MASFESMPTTWTNQSTSSELLLDEEKVEFFVEFPFYDSSSIYLVDSILKEEVLSQNFSINPIELINKTEQFTNLSSGSNTRFESFLLILQGETLASTLSILLAVFLYALSLLTILGNAIVVYAILTERKLRTVSNMFILSLAVADLIVGSIVMPISSTYILTHDWIFGRNFCQFWILTDYTASTASILNILILSLDRYWSIKNPLQYLRKRTKKRALAMIGIVWLISLSWALPILFWHTWYNPDGERKHPETVCETEFSDNIIFKLTSSFVNFLVPIMLMMLLYAKIYLEIKRRGKLNIGRYSSHNHKLSSKNSDQSNAQTNNEIGQTGAVQAFVKQAKSFRLKERLNGKLSVRERKVKNENSIKGVSFSAKDLNNEYQVNCNSSNEMRTKMHRVASDSCNNQNVMARLDLCIDSAECYRKDQITNSLTDVQEKVDKERRTLNGGDSSECVIETKASLNENVQVDLGGEEVNDSERRIAKQKYQQLTILNAGNIENQLKELKTLDTIKVEVQIVTTQDVDENERNECDEINDKENVVAENLNFNKSFIEKNLIERTTEDRIDKQERHENRLSVKKWFLLPKVTVYLQRNLYLDRKRRKQKRRIKQTEFDCSIQEDDESADRMHKVKTENETNTEFQSIDTLADNFNQKARKRKAFRSLLWLRKMTSSTDQQTGSGHQSASQETPTNALKKRIENEETGSLSFDFSSSIPRSLENLPTSSSMQPSSSIIKQTSIQNRLLPFSCSSGSLRMNRGNLRNNQPQAQMTSTGNSHEEANLSKASLINRTLNKNTLTKSAFNLPASPIATSSTTNGETMNTNCLLSNRSTHLQQTNHSLSLHLPSTSSISVNQNSVLTTSSNQDYLTAQSNQSSFYLSRIESSRLKQEKKAALQLGLIMGGFLICWLPYIIVYIVSAQCQCIDNTTHTIAIWLGYINSSLNPVLYFMGPNSSRFKAAFRKLLLRKSVPRHLIDQSIHPNGKIPINPQLMTAPGLTFHNTTLTANSINKRASSVHTRLSRTTSNKSQLSATTKDEFNRAGNKFRRNKASNYSLREINNNTID